MSKFVLKRGTERRRIRELLLTSGPFLLTALRALARHACCAVCCRNSIDPLCKDCTTPRGLWTYWVDEFSRSLMRVSRKTVWSMERLIAQGKTVVFASHDAATVSRLFDRIILMHEGRLLPGWTC
jgi:hypothetical protein